MTEERRFRDAMGAFATGITIVSINDGIEDMGMTVNAFMSISLNPKLIAVSIDKNASLYSKLDKSTHFGVSVLSSDQKDYSMIFARQKEPTKPVVFGKMAGVPVLDDALANLSCEVFKKVEAGDHVIYIGRVNEFTSRLGDPVLYHQGSYQSLIK